MGETNILYVLYQGGLVTANLGWGCLSGWAAGRNAFDENWNILEPNPSPKKWQSVFAGTCHVTVQRRDFEEPLMVSLFPLCWLFCWCLAGNEGMPLINNPLWFRSGDPWVHSLIPCKAPASCFVSMFFLFKDNKRNRRCFFAPGHRLDGTRDWLLTTCPRPRFTAKKHQSPLLGQTERAPSHTDTHVQVDKKHNVANTTLLANRQTVNIKQFTTQTHKPTDTQRPT